MATVQAPPTTSEQRSTSRIGVLRLATTTGVAAGLIFVVCWVGTFISFASPTHAYIGLFTNDEMQSIQALAEGGVWSLLFGFLSGGLDCRLL